MVRAAGFANRATQDRDDDRSKVREMTGCLQKEGDDYHLMADNGSNWELKGEQVNLSDHVGHKVRVNGTVDQEKIHNTKENAKKKNQDKPNKQGHLERTNLNKVTRRCNNEK